MNFHFIPFSFLEKYYIRKCNLIIRNSLKKEFLAIEEVLNVVARIFFRRVITQRNRAYKWVSGCLSPQRSKGTRLVSQIIYSRFQRFDTFKDRFPFAKESASGRPPFRSAESPTRIRSFLVSAVNHFFNSIQHIIGKKIFKTFSNNSLLTKRAPLRRRLRSKIFS